jgi:ribokinase
MAPKTITIIGSLNTDLVTHTPRVPIGGETLTATSFSTGSGGKGANQAVACARLSRPKPSSTQTHPTSDVVVKMVGGVGHDEFGPPLVESMKRDGIDTSGIRIVEGQTTGVAVIIVEEGSGENRILLNPGANYTLKAEDFRAPESLGTPLPDMIVMQLEIPLETVLQILDTAKKAGVDVLLNPAPAVKLPEEAYTAITHLIVNETEAAILSGRRVEEVEKEGFEWEGLASEFLRKGVQNVVVTLGAKGAYYATAAGGAGYIKAEKVEKVVDTTAAGDTFVGAYAVSIVRKSLPSGTSLSEEYKHKPLDEEVIRFACKAAARTVEKRGAQSAIPWADEIERHDARGGLK